MRERWLNPPEWTRTEYLEFPASVDGPWARYIDPASIRNPQSSPGLARYPRLVPIDADCAAKLKARTLTKLYNERPAWLDLAHKKLDAAVARAYGWNDFAEILEQSEPGAIYDFEEGSWMILDTDAKGLTEAHEKFEKNFAGKILERLLALNLERAAAEAKAAKSEKKTKAQREKQAEEML